jgi:hypothetical protein
VSWLLIATTPVLLMLAAVGLERMETGLAGADAASPAHAETTAGYPSANPQFLPTRQHNRV